MNTRPDCLPMPSRFWTKVRITPGCWPWQASTDRRGYGRFGLDGATPQAHRVAWELSNGPIPTGMWVLHRCDNPQCVNPAHLWLGTHEDNMRDMASKGRGRQNHPVGAAAYHAKLQPDQVREIRRLRAAGELQRDVARRFGVSRSTVQDITQGRTYADV